jgi:biotin carboxyl carrier protein
LVGATLIIIDAIKAAVEIRAASGAGVIPENLFREFDNFSAMMA